MIGHALRAREEYTPSGFAFNDRSLCIVQSHGDGGRDRIIQHLQVFESPGGKPVLSHHKSI